MRTFQKYQPLLVAKHVKGFFSGRLYIQGRGAFYYNQGILLLPDNAQLQHQETVQEVNQLISRMQAAMAA